jgi:hypothetical protein
MGDSVRASQRDALSNNGGLITAEIGKGLEHHCVLGGITPFGEVAVAPLGEAAIMIAKTAIVPTNNAKVVVSIS